MALPNLDSNTFRKTVLGIGAGANALAMVTPAHANNQICLPLQEINGYTLSSGASAQNRSLDKGGLIAISANPGPDLGQSPGQLTTVFRNDKLEADCFINNSMYKEVGTEIQIFVGGLPVKYKGRDTFNIQELRDTPSILRLARTQAIMLRP